MKEKKYLKISLGTGILLALIVILIVALVGMYFYYNPKKDEKFADTNTNLPSEMDENTTQKDTNISKEENKQSNNTVKNPYEKYSDLEWDCDEKNIKLEIAKNEEYIIEGGVLYFEKDGERQKINSITDTPKYISAFTTNRISQVNVLTEEGTVWRLGKINKNDFDDADSLLSYGKIGEFKKVNFKDKVVNITYGDLLLIDYSGYYYLLENGDLVNDKGTSYDYLKGDFTKNIGEEIQSQLFISPDNTISYFDYDTQKYNKIRNEKNTIIKVKTVFMSYDNELITFLIDEIDTLYYIDEVDGFIAKKYNDISNEPVKSVIYNNSDQLKIIFTDNKELVVDGILEVYEL